MSSLVANCPDHPAKLDIMVRTVEPGSQPQYFVQDAYLWRCYHDIRDAVPGISNKEIGLASLSLLEQCSMK